MLKKAVLSMQRIIISHKWLTFPEFTEGPVITQCTHMLNSWDQTFSLTWSGMALLSHRNLELLLQWIICTFICNYLGVNPYLQPKVGVLRHHAVCSDSDLCAWFAPHDREGRCLKICLFVKCWRNLKFVFSSCSHGGQERYFFSFTS